jgi:four helix bundle protein
MYNDFTEMPIWQEALKVGELVFDLTNALPKNEDYGLTSQLRRASVSISANIAEGFGRSGSKDKCKFYDYARGSAFETKSLLLYGQKVNYFSKEATDQLCQNIDQVIYSLNKIRISILRSNNQSLSEPEIEYNTKQNF